MKVKMLKLTTYEGKTLEMDEVYDVPEYVAIRWKRNGIAAVRKRVEPEVEEVAEIQEPEVEAEAVEEIEEAEVGEEDVRVVSDDRKPKDLSGDKRTSRRGKQTTSKS